MVSNFCSFFFIKKKNIVLDKIIILLQLRLIKDKEKSMG